MYAFLDGLPGFKALCWALSARLKWTPFQKHVMRVRVKTDDQEFDADLNDGQSVQDLINSKKFNAETFFIQVNGKLSHPKTMLREGDSVRLVGIIYGG